MGESKIYDTSAIIELAIVWQSRLRALGSPLPATDLVIAAQAVNNNMVLVTKDKHFKILKETVAGDLQLEMLG